MIQDIAPSVPGKIALLSEYGKKVSSCFLALPYNVFGPTEHLYQSPAKPADSGYI